MANAPGSFKQTITTKIALWLSTLGYSQAECADFRNLIHKTYKTEECLEILKEMRIKRTRKGISNVLTNHNFWK